MITPSSASSGYWQPGHIVAAGLVAVLIAGQPLAMLRFLTNPRQLAPCKRCGRHSIRRGHDGLCTRNGRSFWLS